MFSYPCGIPDTRDEYFYVTGDLEQVTKFGPNGFIEFLPNLNTGRIHHACAGYYNAQDHFVLLVAGGYTISGGGELTSRVKIQSFFSSFFETFTYFAD